MSTSSFGLPEALQQYLIDVSLREPEPCRRLRLQTLQMPKANMLSAPEQVQLLLLLFKMLDAKAGLEVGTFTGYTSLRLTLGIPELRMICCDVNEEFTAVARTYWDEAGVADRIDLHLAPALQTLDDLIANGKSDSFDFAYVDADKVSYRKYVECGLKLVRPGGLIAIDNTLWSGRVVDPTSDDDDTLALRRFNDWLYEQEEDEYDLSMVPIGDGLTILRKASSR